MWLVGDRQRKEHVLHSTWEWRSPTQEYMMDFNCDEQLPKRTPNSKLQVQFLSTFYQNIKCTKTEVHDSPVNLRMVLGQ
jgi:hypothetical protein